MRPGRPRCPRMIETEPAVTYFKPLGVPLNELEVVTLSLEELEAVRLSDMEDLNQENAAHMMGISRRALWEDLQNARKKITVALVKGMAIEITGGNYTIWKRQRYMCNGCRSEWEPTSSSDEPLQCPECGSKDVNRLDNGPGQRGPGRDCQGGCCKDERKRSM